MSDITVINDSEQSSLVTNGLAKNGELYLKAAGSTDAGAIVVYDSGVWRTFANEAASFTNTYSVDFDGTNESAYLDSYVTITGAASISMWVNYEYVSTARYYLFAAQAEPRIYIRAADQALELDGRGTSANGSLPKDQWNHIVFTRSSSGSANFYVNGGNNKVLGPLSYSSNLSFQYLFRHANGSFALNGKVDECAVWDGTELTTQQVTDIYNSGAPSDLTTFSPTHWWRMGDDVSGTGTTVTDVIAGNDMNLVNTPTFSSDVPS
jgi:hypothetical protein